MNQMKKNILWMLAFSLMVTALSACSNDDDKTEAKTEVTMMYYVKVTDDVLKVADVEVNYVDVTGAQKKEVLTSAEWKKAVNSTKLPLTEGIWAKITPKAPIADGNYQLQVTTVAGYQAKLANGKTVTYGYGSAPDEVPTPAQTSDNVAAWCAKSPTVAFTISTEGDAKASKVDFGGNSSDNTDYRLAAWLYEQWMRLFG